MTDYQEVRTTEHEAGREQRVATFKATQMIWLLLGLLEGVLALRVVFKLIAVNADNTFAKLLYSVTDLFVAPFASLTGAPAAGGMILEISTVIAMIVYFLIAWGIERVVYVLFYRPRGPVSVKQTTVSDHTPSPAPVGVSQTMTTDRTTTQTPTNASQTTVTERTKTISP
ncbi:MAG: YggT family protein [Anaerolineales bacterium]|nr:YggT family protein [Anaerolineales bacterium]